MKYARKYPQVARGTHTPDERLYRLIERGRCAGCGEPTDWSDPRLAVTVCSEECHYRLATRPPGPAS